jgi:DNA repair exonuclease SbcCD ATPase subunit
MGDFDNRLRWIEDRLHAKRIGSSKVSLSRLDFDAYVEEDVEWLLDVVQSREREAEAAAEKAKDEFEQIKGDILELPQAFADTDQYLLSAGTKLKDLTADVDNARKSIGRMRDELGLFDAASEIQLHAARRELADARKKLELEEKAHGETEDHLESRINAYEVLLAKLGADNKALQAKLDGLPPTWQERVLTGSGDVPEWAQVGARVTSLDTRFSEVQGMIVRMDLEVVAIKTPVGEVLCKIDEFQVMWRAS